MEKRYETYTRWLSEFVKYFIAGGLAFIVDFSILMLLYRLFHVHYLMATAIGLLFGFTITYLLSIKWVFRYRSVSDQKSEVSIFFFIGIIGFILSELIMWIGVDILLSTVSMTKLIATGIVFVWNFVIRKILLFRSS